MSEPEIEKIRHRTVLDTMRFEVQYTDLDEVYEFRLDLGNLRRNTHMIDDEQLRRDILAYPVEFLTGVRRGSPKQEAALRGGGGLIARIESYFTQKECILRGEVFVPLRPSLADGTVNDPIMV